jgi:RNA polymerase sigma-B factor
MSLIFSEETKKDLAQLPEEERVAYLLESYRETGDQQSIEALLLIHDRLLKHIAHRHVASSDETYEDLLQVGRVGLLKAAQGYETGHGAKFTSYAYSMIDGELKHHRRDNELLKKPRWALHLYAQVAQATAQLTGKLGREPSVEELAEETNVTVEGIVELRKLFHETAVAPLEEEQDLSAVKSIRYENFSLPLEDRIVLENALDSLSEFQRKVVYLFFYKDLTQTEIGKQLGLSQRKVSRTIASATGSLRDLLRP